MGVIGGGRTLYGHALGILMLKTTFPRVVGDVGNALTWPFPVRYRVVPDATPDRVMGEEPDMSLLGSFVDAAQELEREGVRAITTSCGFLSAVQAQLAAAVSVPVITSALLQVPAVARLLGPARSVGILTERPRLGEAHCSAAGWLSADPRIHVNALSDDAVFPQVFIDGCGGVDFDLLRDEVVAASLELVARRPDTGAIVMECTNFVPFSAAVRHATRLPVYDIYTLVMQTFLATVGQDFPVRLD